MIHRAPVDWREALYRHVARISHPQHTAKLAEIAIKHVEATARFRMERVGIADNPDAVERESEQVARLRLKYGG